MGPIEADKPWDVSAVAGVYRFLQRVQRLVEDACTKTNPTSEQDGKVVRQKLHQTIKKITKDIPELKFNTAIAALMEFCNVWEKENQKGAGTLTQAEVISFVQLLAPFAPFLAEELYQHIVKSTTVKSIHLSNWPQHDETLAQADTIVMAVQINGKVRAELEIEVAEKENAAAILAKAKSQPAVQQWITGKEIVKELYIPGKIISIVVK
jgi:leucyl-tRNA synthetase